VREAAAAHAAKQAERNKRAQESAMKVAA